jgi:hypothetical protein
MADTNEGLKALSLPDTPGHVVRQHWLDLLELCYATRRVTRQEIEPGVQAVVIPAVCRTAANQDLLQTQARAAAAHVPPMAKGVRLQLERLGEFDLALPADYSGWMGKWGKDVAAGTTSATVFIDLAYLEAALVARLSDHGVSVEFGSPLALFRRGTLTDYGNVYEAVSVMVAEGTGFADTAVQLATEILRRLQLYAHVYLHLSSLYAQAKWSIDGDNFVLSVPEARCSLALQYWQLRGDYPAETKVLHDWQIRIEAFLRQAASLSFPASFAA